MIGYKIYIKYISFFFFFYNFYLFTCGLEVFLASYCPKMTHIFSFIIVSSEYEKLIFGDRS